MANFGSTKSGLLDVGYCLLNTKGAIVRDRTCESVIEVGEGTGIYSARICFPHQFRGTILWDTGEENPVYAAEDFNYYDNNEVVLDQVKSIFDQLTFLRGIQAGRWSLKKETSEMTYYDETGERVIASYVMLDSNGKPSLDEVFDRIVVKMNATSYPPEITDPPEDENPYYRLVKVSGEETPGRSVTYAVETNRLVKKLYWTVESAPEDANLLLLASVEMYPVASGQTILVEGSGVFTFQAPESGTFSVNLRHGAMLGEVVASHRLVVRSKEES